MPRHVLARLTLVAALAAAPALAPQEASSRGLRNAAIAGAVALGAVGAIAAASAHASPYHHGYGHAGYGHAPVSYGYGHSYGHDAPVYGGGYVNRYEHSYDLGHEPVAYGYGYGHGYAPAGYGYGHGYPSTVYYNAPVAPVVREVVPPVIVQRTIRHRQLYRTHEVYRPLPAYHRRTVYRTERVQRYQPYYPRRVVRVHKGHGGHAYVTRRVSRYR